MFPLSLGSRCLLAGAMLGVLSNLAYSQGDPLYDWDAEKDPDAVTNQFWENKGTSDGTSNDRVWDFQGTNIVKANAALESNLFNHAYTWDSGAGSTPALLQATPTGLAAAFPGTTQSVSFELWFKPDDLVGTELLYEYGGAGDGTSLSLNGSTLQFVTQQQNPAGTTNDSRGGAYADLSSFGPNPSEFIQAIGVVNLATDTVNLYVNGQLIDSNETVPNGDPPNTTSWNGGNDHELGGSAGNNVANGTSGQNVAAYGDFRGDIAVLRSYQEVIDGAEASALYNAVAAPATKATIEGGVVDIPATAGYTQVMFDKPFDSIPIVVATPTIENTNITDVRIKDVTTDGFWISQVKWDGFTTGTDATMTSVGWLAVENTGGHKAELGDLRLASGFLDKSSLGAETVDFNFNFDGTPIVFGDLQTQNGETIGDGVQSDPFINPRFLNAGTGSFDLQFQVPAGDSFSVAEQFGYIAFERVSGVQTLPSGLDFVSFLSPDVITGQNSGGTLPGVSVNFPGGGFGSAPTVIAEMSRIDGGDVSFLRRGAVSGSSVNLIIDEPRDRGHTTEPAGVFAFGDTAFRANLAVIVPEPSTTLFLFSLIGGCLFRRKRRLIASGRE